MSHLGSRARTLPHVTLLLVECELYPPSAPNLTQLAVLFGKIVEPLAGGDSLEEVAPFPVCLLPDDRSHMTSCLTHPGHCAFATALDHTSNHEPK